MLELAPQPRTATSAPSFRTAVVEHVDPRAGRARVRLEEGASEPIVDAGIAIPGGSDLERGQRVLLAFQELGESWIVGIPGAPPAAAERRLDLSDGASIHVVGTGPGRSVRLVSPDDELLVEYDAVTRRLSVLAPAVDLELRSVSGDIILDAAGAVRLEGDAVEATGRSHVHVGSGDAPGTVGSLLTLDPSAARLAARRFGLTAERATAHVDQSTYRGSRLFARLDILEIVVGRLERIAEQVHESASHVYRTVKELLETRAKRVRTLVGSTYHLTTGRAFLRSREEFKVKGERIHLG